MMMKPSLASRRAFAARSTPRVVPCTALRAVGVEASKQSSSAREALWKEFAKNTTGRRFLPAAHRMERRERHASPVMAMSSLPR
jgi:hypothetical protein